MGVFKKVADKCTTDHISPAGVWLKYRGHLSNISNNMLLGAKSAFHEETGKSFDELSQKDNLPIAEIAKAYKKAGKHWIVVAEDNYGEGSSRELAAMSPRFLGGAAILTKSFARIHETNLKKQGMLPITFKDPSDYNKVEKTDELSIPNIFQIAPNQPLTVILHHHNHKEESILVQHSLTEEQIGWFKAGSCLNQMTKH